MNTLQGVMTHNNEVSGDMTHKTRKSVPKQCKIEDINIPLPQDPVSIAAEEEKGATSQEDRMDISDIGMGCLYILWTMLSFLIRISTIEKPSDNCYYQYVGVACQTN